MSKKDKTTKVKTREPAIIMKKDTEYFISYYWRRNIFKKGFGYITILTSEDITNINTIAIHIARQLKFKPNKGQVGIIFYKEL